MNALNLTEVDAMAVEQTLTTFLNHLLFAKSLVRNLLCNAAGGLLYVSAESLDLNPEVDKEHHELV